MKLIIEIPDEIYQNVLNGTYCGTLYKELKNGTPIPDNATNGDVLMMMFPPSEYMNDEWWNTTYQKGGKE